MVELDDVIAAAELVEAMRFSFERMKLVREPGGAAGLTALLAGRIPVVAGSRVGVILSGGNVDQAQFARLLADGALGPRTATSGHRAEDQRGGQ